uniref:Uncharacterized protein n=1 Tax=Strongyloides stercoralis TaxID=6248 RepID=A0A0K0DSE1_STRER
MARILLILLFILHLFVMSSQNGKNTFIPRSKRYIVYYDELEPIPIEPVEVVPVVSDDEIIRSFIASIAYDIGYIIG